MRTFSLTPVKDIGFLLGEPEFVQLGPRTRRTLSPVLYLDPHPSKYSELFRSLFFEDAIVGGELIKNLMVVNSGFVNDGATMTPRIEPIARWFGVERFGKFYPPSILHDKIYGAMWDGLNGGDITLQQFLRLKEEGDWIFEDALAINGVGPFSSNVAYIVVRGLGYIEWNKKEDNGYYGD